MAKTVAVFGMVAAISDCPERGPMASSAERTVPYCAASSARLLNHHPIGRAAAGALPALPPPPRHPRNAQRLRERVDRTAAAADRPDLARHAVDLLGGAG